MSLGSDAKMRLSIEELVLYNFILSSAHVYIVSSGVHEHLKEAWSDHGHFCGPPPQEHVTGGMQSNVQRLKIQDQACYLPKMCSHGQGMVHVSFLCLVYMFVCFHPALTDLLFQGILLQMSLQRPSWSRATITRMGPEALGRSCEGYSSSLGIQGIQQAPCLEDEPVVGS